MWGQNLHDGEPPLPRGRSGRLRTRLLARGLPARDLPRLIFDVHLPNDPLRRLPDESVTVVDAHLRVGPRSADAGVVDGEGVGSLRRRRRIPRDGDPAWRSGVRSNRCVVRSQRQWCAGSSQGELTMSRSMVERAITRAPGGPVVRAARSAGADRPVRSAIRCRAGSRSRRARAGCAIR